MSQHLVAPVLLLLLGCNQTIFDNGDGGAGDGGGPGPTCSGLRCQVVDCSGKGGGSTTLSGVVNIPAGTLPLYNALVYVPNVPPMDHFTDGPSCDRCSGAPASDPVTYTHTDASGHFVLKDVPAGTDIPLYVSLGKWQRVITIPSVPACADTPLDPALTRLPRNQTEGHLPKIALTTGGYDAIECLLRKLGIDDAEFTPESGTGRVNLFTGHGGTSAYGKTLNNGARLTVASDAANTTSGWWSKPGSFGKYDILVLSCEGQQYLEEKSPMARAALQDFINAGGRVFASHWHNAWIAGAPAPLSSVATFLSQAQSQNFTNTVNTTVDESTAKGMALADWLLKVGASPQRDVLPIRNARNTVATYDSSLVQRFVYYNDPGRHAEDTQYISFNAPVGAAAGQQCGRMVFTDIHVSGNDANAPDPRLDQSGPSFPFPGGCVTSVLSPQEQALIFLLFDLTDCVQPILM